MDTYGYEMTYFTQDALYEQGGVKLLSSGVMTNANDETALLLAENNSGKTLTIDDAYDSLSVNGFMTDYSYYSQELKDGASAVLAIQLWESSLEENHIASVSDIQEIEAGFEIKEGYTTVDEPTLTLMFGA